MIQGHPSYFSYPRFFVCCVIKRLQYYIYGCASDALHLPAAGRSQAKAALAEFRGYNYFGEKLYNPFDILLFIFNGLEFRNYWWNTGGPSFLIEKLKEENYYIPDIKQTIISEEALNAFDVEYIDLLALLWQTGYLTFEDKVADELGVINYRQGKEL